MLILCRKINESVVIDGSITVKVLRIDGDQVRLGIQAPSDVPVHRHEIYEEIQRNNREAATQVRPNLPRLAPRAHTPSQPTPPQTTTQTTTPPVPPATTTATTAHPAPALPAVGAACACAS